MNEAYRVGSWLKGVGVLLVILTALYGLKLAGDALAVAKATPYITPSGQSLPNFPDTFAYYMAFVVAPTFFAFILCLVLWGFGILVQHSVDRT